MNKEMSYQKQIAVFKMRNSKNETKVLSLVDNMSQIEEENEKDKALPFDFFSSYSRLEMQLIKSDAKNIDPETKKPKVDIVVCNLDPCEVQNLYCKTQSALNAKMFKDFGLFGGASIQNSSENSPCYTVRFNMGNLKGKTPAQVGNKEELLTQREFLQKNVSKYPDNQKLIDAIDDYIEKEKTGSLNNASSSTTSFSGLKPVTFIDEQEKTRLRTTKVRLDEHNNPVLDKEGKKIEGSLITGVKIVCDFTRNVPINVCITNYYAPVVTNKDGSQNIVKSLAFYKTDVDINLSFDKWMEYISKGNTFVDIFKNLEAKNCFALAEKYCWHPDSSKGGNASNSLSEHSEEKTYNSNSSTNPNNNTVSGKKESSATQKNVRMRISAKTDCIERRQYPGDFSMQAVNIDENKTVNVVFSHLVIPAIPNWERLVERSKNREEPLTFEGIFEETKENNVIVYQFVEFAK